MKLHSKHREGGKKVLREIYSGDDYFHKRGTWSVIYRLIDRAKNWYEEKIWDRETGKLIISKAEPLTDHQKPKPGQLK
ncbi:MAG TPA: hypothetical protein VJP60_05860 [Rhizomicrobium sp.]|nr:hypothetical protein [Rhizomicrobium sp.]